MVSGAHPEIDTDASEAADTWPRSLQELLCPDFSTAPSTKSYNSLLLLIRRLGKRIDINDYPWMMSPFGTSSDNDGPSALQHDHAVPVASGSRPPGLLESFDQLRDDNFNPDRLNCRVRSFYEETSRWSIHVWLEYTSIGRPIGLLMSRLYTARFQQLNFPTGGKNGLLSLDNEVVVYQSPGGTRIGSTWRRRLKTTNKYMYRAWYDIVERHGEKRVRVIFPAPDAHIMMILKPEVRSDGGLRLTSPNRSPFGGDGTYIVHPGDAAQPWASRLPFDETLDIFADEDDTLRTDHILKIDGRPGLNLHYLIFERK
jgi:hypothetical protein